jgi:hypothetical protein
MRLLILAQARRNFGIVSNHRLGHSLQRVRLATYRTRMQVEAFVLIEAGGTYAPAGCFRRCRSIPLNRTAVCYDRMATSRPCAQSIAACTRFDTRSSRAECHGSGLTKLVR